MAIIYCLRLLDLAHLFVLQPSRGIMGHAGSEKTNQRREGANELGGNDRQQIVIVAVVSKVRFFVLDGFRFRFYIGLC